MRLPLALLTLLAGLREARAQAQPLSPAVVDTVRQAVTGRVQSGRVPGMAVGLIGPDGVSQTILAGQARAGVPMDAHTVVEIGSITKAFTGILLAEMAARGEVRLDQSVSELLPEAGRPSSRNGKAITLEQLSMHTSGLPRLPNNMRPANPDNPYADYGADRMYEFLRGHELRRDPGAQYEYSNLGAGLLGHVLALRAGTSFEELMRARVLAPLGMASSGTALTDQMRGRAASGHSADGDVVPRWDIPTLAGAGALRSTLDDMLGFLSANLSPADDGLGRAIAASQAPRFRVNSALSLGLNWHRSSFRGDTMVWHNGGTAGFRTFLGWNPRTRTGIVLLSNASQDNEDIARHVLLGMPLAKVEARTEVVLPDSVLAGYVGRYEFAPTFTITVTLEDGRLFAQATDQPRFRTHAEARDRFFYRVVDAQLEFRRGASGSVEGVVLVQGGGRNAGRRLPD